MRASLSSTPALASSSVRAISIAPLHTAKRRNRLRNPFFARALALLHETHEDAAFSSDALPAHELVAGALFQIDTLLLSCSTRSISRLSWPTLLKKHSKRKINVKRLTGPSKR